MTLTGEDTFLINDKPLMLDTSNGDIVTLDFPNDVMTMTTGKNGNTIYALNEQGGNADVTVKLTRGSASDKFLNGLLADQRRDFVSFTTMNGAFVKRLGDGLGGVKYDTYSIQGMMFNKVPSGKSNTEGDAEQGSVTYNLKAAMVTRGIL